MTGFVALALLATLAFCSTAGAQPPAGVRLPAAAQSSTDVAVTRDAARDDVLSRLRITGSVRAAYWSSSRNLDHFDHFAVASVWLQASAKLASQVSLFVEGWGRDEDVLGQHEPSGKLREAYLDLGFGRVSLRVGRQIIAWGRADRINPTDNLTSLDFTLLVPEDADQRLGTTAAKATYTRA